MRLLSIGLIPLALIAARLKADTYWGGPPPCGEPVIRVAKLDEGVFGQADMDACAIVINGAWRRWPWPALCTIAIHEDGHLHGLTHSSPQWVMHAGYRGAVKTCRSVSPWLATPSIESDWPETYDP